MIRSARGQSTVEFALVLPLLVLVALAVVQVAAVVDDRVQLTHAARVGARAASVGATDSQVRADVVAATSLDASRLEVQISRTGGAVTVTVRYRAATGTPVVGVVLADVELVSTARMPREPP